ncbi:MAG: hypothetical protein ABEJ31_14140 [Haloarculaceae archaeon]
MIDGLDAAVVGSEAAATRRDEVVAQVREHAGRIARELARLQGGDYGSRTFETDAGAWTLKYEGGDVQYLRFEASRRETYVVSEKQASEPAALADAMADYANFVAAFEDHVDSLEGVLDDVDPSLPPVASTDAVVAERERLLERVRECADEMAGQLHRYEGNNYGSFAARVNGRRWELKWEDGRASYLRVGGEDGIYLLSQYQPPSVPDLRAHAPDLPAFVEAYNDHVAEISDALETVAFDP